MNPDLSSYAQKHDPTLISRIQTFLGRPDVQATKGAQRINLVCNKFKELTFEQAYHLIDADAFQDEFEETQSYKGLITLLNFLRILLSLAPLIFTWFALFSAASSYQNDLLKFQDDQSKAFLQLWQEGFHYTTYFTFSFTAVGDVILLLLLLTSSVVILWLEYRIRRVPSHFALALPKVTDGLLQAVSEEGISPVTSQADIDKIVKAVRIALGSAFTNTETVIKQVEKVVLDANQVILKANDRVEQLFTQQVSPLFTQFANDVNSFQGNINNLTKEVTILGTASAGMAGSAALMATSTSALDSTTKGMDTHLVTLNKTEASLVAEFNRTATSMDRVAKNVGEAAGKMEQAAQKVEHIGQNLNAINPQMVQQIAREASQFMQGADTAAKELQITIKELKKLNSSRKFLGIFRF